MNSYSIINDDKNFCLEEVDYSISSDKNALQDDYPIGLYLGETSSCIDVYRDDGVEIIPNRDGEKTTPSIVIIKDENTILKGEETIEYRVKYYYNSIFGIKRFLGMNIYDKHLIEIIEKENFPFKIVLDEKRKLPLILIYVNNKKIAFTLEGIYSFIIRKMVDSAKVYLEKKANNLVITVPAYFNDSKKSVLYRM